MPEQHEDSSNYPLNLPLFQNDFSLNITAPILIISGENGSGKSTLLESIASHCGFNLSGGSRNHVYEETNDVKKLAQTLRFSWKPKVTKGFFMRAESFYNFANYLEKEATIAGEIMHAPYGGKSLHEQSHGEAFLSLFNNQFNSKGIYVLDEPEAALSPMRQLSLLSILKDMELSGVSQVIMSTHSPILMSYPTAQFLYISNNQLEEIPYQDTEHYQITRRFLEAPELIYRNLFDDDE